LAARLRRKDVSAREVMAAHLARIERINPQVNAIVTLVADRAMADAARADEATARGDASGVLHGLPVAHKDLIDTAGIRTTKGSPFYRDTVPTRDAPIVVRWRAAGAITVGKTNTPELGAGSQTFNTLFGPTRNPYDLTRTCGGSSGGSAVALACGLVPVADGTDVGGSLRNPAAFCNVVGLRPSPGRVPGDAHGWSPFGVFGPMGRSVADVALFLSVIAGDDPRSPLSIREDPARFRASLEREVTGTRGGSSPGREWRGGRASAESLSNRKSAPWWTRTAACSRVWNASRKTRSPISPASPTRFRCCDMRPATRRTRRSYASGRNGSRTPSSSKSPRPGG
jgi:amidase